MKNWGNERPCSWDLTRDRTIKELGSVGGGGLGVDSYFWPKKERDTVVYYMFVVPIQYFYIYRILS